MEKQQSLPPSKYALKQFMLLLLREQAPYVLEQAPYVLGVITSTQIPPVTSKQYQDFLIKNKVALVAKTGSDLVESAVTSSFDNKTMAALAQFLEQGGNINAWTGGTGIILSENFEVRKRDFYCDTAALLCMWNVERQHTGLSNNGHSQHLHNLTLLLQKNVYMPMEFYR